MATLDLGQFEHEVGSSRSFGPATYRQRVHVVRVTESEREERCRACGAVIPIGGEFYLVAGSVLCVRTYELAAQGMKPVEGYHAGYRYGGSEVPEPRRRPRRHRR
jgi:hypothetical protein